MTMPRSSVSTILIMSFLLFLLLTPRQSSGFRFPYIIKGDQTETPDGQRPTSSPDTDLKTLLWIAPNSQSQVYTNALQVLEGLRASPSCHRLAAATLIHSCQSIDGSNPNPEDALEDVKSVYATQLALCEITDAGSRPPPNCEAFLPSNIAQSGRKLSRNSDRPAATTIALKGKLGLCLQSLESRPQHWTSYSNNRQNAVIMCQAARIDVDKDDLIKLHKSLINTTADANSALMRALATANEALLKQRQFGTEVERFQQQLTQDLEASKTKTQSYLRTLMKNIESTLQNTIKSFADKVKKVETEAENVQKALRSSAAEAYELRLNIEKFIQQAVEGTAELAASQTGYLEATSSSTAQLRNSLQSMRDQQVQSLLGAFDSIHNQIQVSNELVGVMSSRQNDLDERLMNLDRSFAGLESSAAALHKTHSAEAEAQLRLRNQLQVELQVAQGLIADITASAASLQASLHDTSSKVAHIVTFGGLSDRILTWAWCLVALLILWQFNPRYSRYAATTLGMSCSMTVEVSNA
ncbi:MAG: hypothetical protein Q9209_006317 [Squamulea sp. 1 TL-2023]